MRFYKEVSFKNRAEAFFGGIFVAEKYCYKTKFMLLYDSETLKSARIVLSRREGFNAKTSKKHIPTEVFNV